MQEQTCSDELKYVHYKINVETLDKPFIFSALTFQSAKWDNDPCLYLY